MNRSDTGDTGSRSAPLLWGSGALAAIVLVLAVNGTLSSWTTAIINNDANTADSASSVVLEETGPDSTGLSSTTCTTAGTATNTDTCSTINKYGDTGVKATGATALQPGGSVTTTVSLTNTGSGDASVFTLTPAACSSLYYSGTNSGSAPAVGDNLCSQLEVAVVCTGGATLTVASQSLAAFATAGAQTLVGGLASGATSSCVFTVTLPSTTPANYSGQTVTQALEWKIVV
ncbi:MAG: hypothetical protein WC642_12390 [Nocardioides sp.]|jgi:hypothetical protein